MPQAERLHDRATAAPLPSRGRNPFVYGVRPPARAASSPRDAAVIAPPPAPVVTEPPLPALRLTGIASAFEDGMATLTAIVTVNGAMSFVKAGGQLAGGYTVLRVDETSVVLVDAAGVTQTLWSMDDIVGLVEQYEEGQAPKKRGPYKKHAPEISN